MAVAGPLRSAPPPCTAPTTRPPATFRLRPCPTIGISTVRSSNSSASAGIPVDSWPRTTTVRRRATGRSASLIDSSTNSTPIRALPRSRCPISHVTGSAYTQCTQDRRRSVFPRCSASGTQGSLGTARHAPTASQVRSKVPRFTPCLGHSEARITWSQQECARRRRWLRSSSRGRSRGALTEPERRPPLHRYRAASTA